MSYAQLQSFGADPGCASGTTYNSAIKACIFPNQATMVPHCVQLSQPPPQSMLGPTCPSGTSWFAPANRCVTPAQIPLWGACQAIKTMQQPVAAKPPPIPVPKPPPAPPPTPAPPPGEPPTEVAAFFGDNWPLLAAGALFVGAGAYVVWKRRQRAA